MPARDSRNDRSWQWTPRARLLADVLVGLALIAVTVAMWWLTAPPQ